MPETIPDGSCGLTVAKGTWHTGFYPLATEVKYLDITRQRESGMAPFIESRDLKRDLGVDVEIVLA
ncbi:MAG: hypothetical protein HYZ81_07350 [Nitrospinae bacterium]|nr:hypothetical protein [Nitrospinota bacterium]